MAITNQERVGKAMELLRAGLAPFVEREFKNLHQAQATDAARRYLGDDRTVGKKPLADWDVAALLKLMWEAWNDVFGTDARSGRALAGAGAARLAQQVGAPGAVLERRRRPRARLDGAAAHRRLGAAGRRGRAR